MRFGRFTPRELTLLDQAVGGGLLGVITTAVLEGQADVDLQIERGPDGRLLLHALVLLGDVVMAEHLLLVAPLASLPSEVAATVLWTWVSTIRAGLDRWKRRTSLRLKAAQLA